MLQTNRMRLLSVCACAVSLAAAGIYTASAQAPANANEAGVPKIAFEKYTLPNGLQVILHVDRKLPMVHVNSWYHVG